VKPVLVAFALSFAGLPALAQGTPPADAPAVTKANTATPPNASDLLFEEPQMKNVAPGSTLTYAYLRRSGISKGPFGPTMDDQIKHATGQEDELATQIHSEHEAKVAAKRIFHNVAKPGSK
jgi:hypothetical protein